MDRFEQIVARAQLAVCVCGSAASFELEAITPCTAERFRAIVAERRGFLGVAAIVDGSPRTALNEPLDDAEIHIIAQAFSEHVIRVLCEKLHVPFEALPEA